MSTKVTVLGAGGGIGQPLSLLLKLSPEIDELACYDIVGAPGVAADLSHVSTILLLLLRDGKPSDIWACSVFYADARRVLAQLLYLLS